MERPSTASSRPRTSTGRAPSARARPPSATRVHPPPTASESRPMTGMSMRNGGPPMPAPPSRNGIIPVPPSRSGMIPVPPSRSGAPPAPMPVSRAGGPPRAPTSMGGRPMTGMARPPTAGLRPVTQQGLRAPPSRMGTGNARQVFDKSYYIALLRAKQNAIKVEISKLKEKRDIGLKARNDLPDYESRASTQAELITDLQGKLLDLNKIMEKIQMNGDMSDIELEASKMRDQADEMKIHMDDALKERTEKEEELRKLEGELEEQKKLNEAVTHAMDPQTKEKFEELKAEVTALREKVTELEAKKEEMDDKISKFEIDIRSDPLKKKAVALQDTLESLKKQEQELMTDMQNALTPEAWREKIVESMKQLNADLVVIEKQHKEVKDKISLASEELHEYNSQGETQIMAHHTKYLELLSKSTLLDEEPGDYPAKMKLVQQETEEIANAIVLNLKKISANLKKVNLGNQITDLDERGLNLNSGNIEELKEMHVRLQDEMYSTEDLEMALNAEVDEMMTKMEHIRQEIAPLRNTTNQGDLREEMEERKRDLESKAPGLSNEMKQLEVNVAAIRNELHAIPGYAEHKALLQKLDAIEKRIAAKTLDYNLRKAEVDYTEVKAKTLQLQQAYNEKLLASTQKRFN